MSETVLATSIVAFTFGYLAVKMDPGQTDQELNIRPALIQYSNLFLCYGAILTTLYLGIQNQNYSGFSLVPGGEALLVGFVNVFSLMVLGLFFFITWDFYLKFFKEEKDVGGGGGKQ